VYRRPATAFVARFIGSTNILHGTAAGAGRVRLADRDLQLAQADGARDGERIVVSIRPEDAHLLVGDAAATNALPGRVVFVRDLGELFECYVDCGLDQHVVVAGSPRERVHVEQGQAVMVQFPPESCVVVRE
jgi:ABC-type Fe3+/spermidine/putrescine transport system ATPase subunit